MADLIVRTEPLGGSPLAALALSADADEQDWFVPAPMEPAAWTARVVATQGRFKDAQWYDALRPAFGNAKSAASERLARVARAGGVVVTTGQQPGLLGGPLYTLHKALSALALADALEQATGVPVAPVFWAATDDADIEEARTVAIAVPGGVQWLRGPANGPEGTVMGLRALGDVAAGLEAAVRSAGDAADPELLAAVRAAYSEDASVGGAYVTLMRRVLEPLGISVLDAWHDATRTATTPHLRGALASAQAIAESLRARTAEIEAAGFTPQVREVAGLSLVFSIVGGVKRRIPLSDAGTAPSVVSGSLSANVLLRPVVEGLVLPTVAYTAGPGELAYFAQATAVADALGVCAPLGVPRWSATIIEPHVARILERRGLSLDELSDPHAAETERARAQVDVHVSSAIAVLRSTIDSQLGSLEGHADATVPVRAIEGTRLMLHHRIERLERRFVAAAKRADTELMGDVGTARGALRPDGVRQERVLAWLPLLARHGEALLASLRRGAAAHAERLVQGAVAAE